MRRIRLGVGYDRSSSSHLVSHLSFFRNSARLPYCTQYIHTIYTYHIYIPLLSSYPSCASILTDIHHDNFYRRYHPRQEAPHRSSRLWPNGPTTRCQCTYCQLNLPHLGLTLLVHFLTLLKYQRSYKTTTLRPKSSTSSSLEQKSSPSQILPPSLPNGLRKISQESPTTPPRTQSSPCLTLTLLLSPQSPLLMLRSLSKQSSEEFTSCLRSRSLSM